MKSNSLVVCCALLVTHILQPIPVKAGEGIRWTQEIYDMVDSDGRGYGYGPEPVEAARLNFRRADNRIDTIVYGACTNGRAIGTLFWDTGSYQKTYCLIPNHGNSAGSIKLNWGDFSFATGSYTWGNPYAPDEKKLAGYALLRQDIGFPATTFLYIACRTTVEVQRGIYRPRVGFLVDAEVQPLGRWLNTGVRCLVPGSISKTYEVLIPQ